MFAEAEIGDYFTLGGSYYCVTAKTASDITLEILPKTVVDGRRHTEGWSDPSGGFSTATYTEAGFNAAGFSAYYP